MNNEDREAFIALIAPIGIDLEQVNSVLSERLRQISYEPNIIKLTDELKSTGRVPKNFRNEVERYREFIKAGDKICADSKRGDILVLLSIARLLSDANGEENRDRLAKSRRVNVFRQIKRLDEYATLERVYGRNIIFLGCYASKEKRISYLVDRMRVTDRGSNIAKLESHALEIMSIDEDETDNLYGQRIIDCYPKSDYIIDCSNLKTLELSIDRFLQIYFGHPFISPNIDEYASYIANAAAYRSLDLSRQVGAAIFGNNGEIIAMGCNEVPSPEGGTYWNHSNDDVRDFQIGYDSNQRFKEDLARDALDKLKIRGWLSEKLNQMDLDKIVNDVFKEPDRSTGDESGPWHDAMISNIIEYGRMVHAEMNAITDAARFRRSTQGATLYCTTMPCHMCTKLIIASGIRRVVYVQPYVKSMTGELFKDSVAFDCNDHDHRVNFTSLRGVTPAGFKRAFSRSKKRKNKDGNAIKWNKLKAIPNFLTTFPYYIQLELQCVEELRLINEGDSASGSST